MEGITAGECRSVFLDWAISSRPAAEEKPALVALFAHYGSKFPEHPMTEVLQQAVAAPVGKPRRRGGVRTGRRDQGQD